MFLYSEYKKISKKMMKEGLEGLRVKGHWVYLTGCGDVFWVDLGAVIRN